MWRTDKKGRLVCQLDVERDSDYFDSDQLIMKNDLHNYKKELNSCGYEFIDDRLLSSAAYEIASPNYVPCQEGDPYVLAQLLLKRGAILQPANPWDNPVRPRGWAQNVLWWDPMLPLPAMHISLGRDHAGLVEFFMKYNYRLDEDDLQLALQHSAEKSCIALMNWGAFIPNELEQEFFEVESLFCEVADYHLLGLMRIMIHNNPQYLQMD